MAGEDHCSPPQLTDKMVGLCSYHLCVRYLFKAARAAAGTPRQRVGRAYAIWSTVTGLGVGNENLISEIIISRLE